MLYKCSTHLIQHLSTYLHGHEKITRKNHTRHISLQRKQTIKNYAFNCSSSVFFPIAYPLRFIFPSHLKRYGALLIIKNYLSRKRRKKFLYIYVRQRTLTHIRSIWRTFSLKKLLRTHTAVFFITTTETSFFAFAWDKQT